MRKQMLVWGGAVVAVAAVVALAVHLARVGLDDADKLASVIGLFVALAGLGVSIRGLTGGRRGDDPSTPPPPAPDVAASGSDASAPVPDGATSQPDVQAAQPDGSAPEPGVSAPGARSVAVGGDNSGIISTGDGTTNVQMRAEASGQGRVYQAGGDQTINEK
ncbi:hypothetical protein OIE67_37735 [Nonomuraea fuscirosea]|uniref:hypothetical protein n=1 Tax=Nonomuraea fuscirosea TaxID=1291556 RepID=UPI002DDB79E0|nr:hypothetical protein [Nonomuraea fuscirosea]WSA49773.1 hypothetical protein OIE67_37735 [Nonomuraea fuscirosea]